MNDSIIRITVAFIFYAFLVTVTYFLLSTPVELMFSSFENADMGRAEDEANTYIPIFRNAFTIAIGCFISLPITWFVMKIFSREPAYYQYRRY